MKIFPPEEMIEATIERLPLSKSITARALVLAAMSGTEVPGDELPDCADIRVLRYALSADHPAEVDVADSGTALRFLTAYYAVHPGYELTITGSPRLCQRPIGPLVDALRALGADIEYSGAEGCAPLRIRGERLGGGEVTLDASASSQFASALALAAPAMTAGLRIHLGGQIPSMPYLKMTLQMLESRGIESYLEGYDAVIMPGKVGYGPKGEAEHDWSAAAFWYAIAAVSAGWFTLKGLKAESLQGDSILKDIGERFGVVTEFTDEGAELSATPDIYSRLDMDMSDWPDLVPALAVTGALIGLPYVFSGVGNLRLKECDRLAALQEGLAQLGIVTVIGADTFEWEGERVPIMAMPQIDPHGDHRIAMAFAVASLAIPGIEILHPEVVEKSYPGFFDDLAAAGFQLQAAEAE